MNSFQNYGSYHPVNNSDNNATHEYIDCDIINNSTDLSPIPVVFNNVKTRQIIDDCSDYYLSVVRWSLESGLPQIIPEIQLGVGSNVDTTVYKINIGIENLNGDPFISCPFAAKTVTFVPDNLTVPIPGLQPTTADQVYNNPYYYVNSISHFLQMVNKTLVESYNALYTWQALPGNPVLLPLAALPTAPPHFDWNGSEISANMDAKWIYKTNIPAPTIPANASQFRFYICMNTPLYNLFDTFPSKFLSKTIASSNLGRNYALMFYENQWDDTYSAGDPLVDYYFFNQEGSSVPAWSPVSSIVFQTSTIPVNPTQSGAPVYAGTNLKDSIQASGISNILTDFQIPLDRGDEYTNALLYYTPSSEYRLFDMNSNGPLKDLNIQLFWKDKLGFIHPFLMKNGASASLKLLLRKKSFNGL
jgi:hypothetical protein